MESRLIKLTSLLENLAPSLAGGEMPAVPSRTRELYTHLLNQDVDERLALAIATQIAETTDEKDDVWTALKSCLTAKIETAEPFELDFDAKRPKVSCWSAHRRGQTTTLAKISAQYRYNPNWGVRPKIVFITADLYRLAAVNSPEIHRNPRRGTGGHLFARRSPPSSPSTRTRTCAVRHRRDLPAQHAPDEHPGRHRGGQPPLRVHLVISSTTKYSDMVDVVDHFGSPPSRLIFTKIDESTTYGPAQYDGEIQNSHFVFDHRKRPRGHRARGERIANCYSTGPRSMPSSRSSRAGFESPRCNHRSSGA